MVETGCCGNEIAKSMTTRRISASFHPFPVVASEANRRKDYNRGFGAFEPTMGVSSVSITFRIRRVTLLGGCAPEMPVDLHRQTGTTKK